MCCGNSLTTKVYNKIRFSMELIITNPWCSATSSRHIKWGACLFKKEESTSVLGNLLMLWVEPERFFTPTRPQTQSLIGWGRWKFPVLIQRELRGGWKECRDRGGRGTWSLEEGASFSDSWSPWKRALEQKLKETGNVLFLHKEPLLLLVGQQHEKNGYIETESEEMAATPL